VLESGPKGAVLPRRLEEGEEGDRKERKGRAGEQAG